MIPENLKEKLDKLYQLNHEILKKMVNIWKNEIVFSFHWWIGLLFFIGPWITWVIFHDRKRTSRLLFVGFFVIIFSSYIDFIGVEMNLWSYNLHLAPTIPAYFVWDFSLQPVSIMFLLQYKPQANPYIKALIFSFLASFVGEPFYTWLGFYEQINWKHYYSFPIQFTLFLICYWLSQRKSFREWDLK